MYVDKDKTNYFTLDETLSSLEYREHLEDGWFKGTIEDDFNIVYESL
jgi:hypothetical protein